MLAPTHQITNRYHSFYAVRLVGVVWPRTLIVRRPIKGGAAATTNQGEVCMSVLPPVSASATRSPATSPPWVRARCASATWPPLSQPRS